MSLHHHVTDRVTRSRSVRAGGRRQGGEPEAQVGEPGPGPVHREPHVCLQRLPDHRHQEQTKVKRKQCPDPTWLKDLAFQGPGGL